MPAPATPRSPALRALTLAIPALAAAVAAGFVYLAIRTFLQRRAAEADPHIRVESLTDDTHLAADGSVRSVQSGDVWFPSDRLDAVWTPENLERLARTYWFNLGRVSFHLLRVMYTPTGRAMALFGLIPLITFDEPEYEFDDREGRVRWIIRNGLLVSRRGAGKNGYLQIFVSQRDSDRPGMDRLHVELSIANFYPSLADSISKRLYSATQSRIHVLVVYSFLRSLARGELVPSKIGRFAQWPKELGTRLDERREARRTADTAS